MTTTITIEETWVHWFAMHCHCRNADDQWIVSRDVQVVYWAMIVQTAWFGLMEVEE